MGNINKDYKIILECNKQGIVKNIFLDTISLLENIELPVGIHSLVLPDSSKELGDFWLSIQKKSMAKNTLLSLSFNDKEVAYLFSGYLLKETILLCGNTELSFTEKALEEIMLINNEQSNQIRLTEKKMAKILKEDKEREINEVILNDFTSLNNELINNKRELMRKNQRIELLNEELGAVNENMTMFTYSVSHDLKEPVRMISSFLTLFHQKYGDSLDEKGQTYINFALDGANRLSKMMEDLLAYHRSSNIDTNETVDLNDVLLEVKKILQREINDNNVQINSAKLPVVKGSNAGFTQVFQNLISNAIKFIPVERTPKIFINVDEDDTYYTFSVKDNGIGIAENKRQEVFNLFKRLNAPRQYEGSGMGLAMVKLSIERMGGKVWVESEEGKGSTFYFNIRKRL